jgi:type IV pilus modification protein PilV
MMNLGTHQEHHHPFGERGFSMVEMLLAAFIMAFGLLGLALLQTMSLRSVSGSSFKTTAILVAERVLDQAEALGRNSLLCSRSGSTVTNPATTNGSYFSTTAPAQYFRIDGTTDATVTAANGFFTLTVPATLNGTATNLDVVAPVTGVGGVRLITVQVSWNEGTNSGGTFSRNVTISRRIPYATS